MLIQKLRLQHGWSQEQLAALSGLSVRTIQRLEQGKTASIDSLKALASAFDMNFNHLMDPDREPSQPRSSRTDETLALTHVRAIKAFYIHIANYVVIVGLLVIVNALSSPNYWWVAWVAGSWGVGLLADAQRTFGETPFLNGDWERREVEKVLGRKL